MPRPAPHPLALFSLKPLNPRAEAVLAHPDNKRLVSQLKSGELALDIGHTRSTSGDNTTIATLGRCGDIVVEGPSIAKIQCSFEIDLDTNVVMFYDRSHSQTSQVLGQNATPFEYGRPRKIVVQEEVNTIIGLGGVGRNLVQFELEWHYDAPEAMEIVRNRASTALGPHTTAPQQTKLRYANVIRLGSGQFGVVYKAVDVDSGKLLAVKTLKRPQGASDQEWRTILHGTLRREVDILSRISHPHIVDYIASRGWNEGKVEIFMGLKEGTLQSLIRGGCSIPVVDLGTTVLYHMLQAIDFLAMNGIVHRDIKPENILYVSRPGQYYFQLGDFGLSNRQIIATTFAGSMLYVAPEMFQNGEQTHKADVWSLYVTMLWTLDVAGFRDASKTFKAPDDARAAVLLVASNTDSVSVIQQMARPNPNERASAAQMLVKCFDGKGLTIPQNQVPPLIEPGKSDGKAPARPVPAQRKKKENTERSPRERSTRSSSPTPHRQGPVSSTTKTVDQSSDREASGPTPSQDSSGSSMGLRMPGAFPSNVVGTVTEARRQPRIT